MSDPAASPFLCAESVRKSYVMPGSTLEVLKGVDLEVGRGEIHAIMGTSGVGKSTLLHILGTLDRPTSGRVLFEGQDVFGRPDADLALFRNERIGFVFQFHHLLPEFTAVENVMMPGLIAKVPVRALRARAMDLLASVGLSERARHRPDELSGGEQQRVALARALVRSPHVVIADEPSGNLDPDTAERLHELVYTLAKGGHQSWLIATHNEKLALLADKRSRLVQGRLVLDAGTQDIGSHVPREGWKP